MRKLFLLVRSNLRRERGQTLILVALLIIGAMVLNLLLMLSTDYRSNFDRWHEKLHAEDVLLTIEGDPASAVSGIRKVLDGESDVTEYELREGRVVYGTIPYNDGTLTNAMVVVPADGAEEWKVGRVEITAETEDDLDGLYYPLMYESDKLAPGKDAEIEINGEAATFPTAGFFNSVMAGSHNCGIMLLLAGDETYEKLLAASAPVTVASIRVSDRERSSEIQGELTQALFEELPDAALAGTDYARNRVARYVAQSITAAILAAAVCFVLIVAMTVAASNAATHVHQSMPELGILKSVGYTGSSLIAAMIFQYVCIAAPASIAGAALAYTVFPELSNMMTAQTGIPYDAHFLSGPFAASCILCTAVIALCVWFAARRIRRIEPITALRSGVETHSFRRNHVPLGSSRLPLSIALSLKDCLNSPRRNITICVTMAALTLLIVFAATMTTNIVTDEDPILDLIGVERAHVMFSVAAADEDKLLEALGGDERVERYYLYHQDTQLGEPGGSGLSAVIIDDPDKLQNQKILYEGRLPIYDNEVAIGAKHALERGLAVGDTIDLGTGDNSKPYLIVGLSQGTNYLGDDAYLTREGYKRIESLDEVTYYIDLNGINATDDAAAEDVDKFIEDLQEKLGNVPGTGMNQISWKNAMISVYVVAIQAIICVLAVLTILLTVLVMGLLTRTVLNTRMHEFGILKAIGYTTKNLVWQTLLSFMSVLIPAEVAGFVLWSLTANSIISLFMRSLGTMRCSFDIPAGLIAGLGIALLGFSLCIIALMAGRIRRVEPVTLLADD